jgi:hypothetical protein
MEEDLRRRFRRDYTAEPIRVTSPAAVPATNTPPPAPQAPAKDSPTSKFLSPAKLMIAILLIVIVAAGGFFALHQKHAPKNPVKHYFPSSITKDQIQIPVYYPINLPGNLIVDSNTFKVIQKNVLYYSVSNRAGDKFYITIQPLASNFDFVAFKKKFVKPDEYQTPIGSNLVGVAGTSLIGSIQTNKNVWILLNSSAIGSISTMETITRSFQEVSL